MKINKINIDIAFSARELKLLQYCCEELLVITKELDLKRGFNLNSQQEVEKIRAGIDAIRSNLTGDL